MYSTGSCKKGRLAFMAAQSGLFATHFTKRRPQYVTRPSRCCIHTLQRIAEPANISHISSDTLRP
jgi:hypothetical protein